MNIGPGVSLRELNRAALESIQRNRHLELRDKAEKVRAGLLIGAGVAVAGTLGAIVVAGPGAAAAAVMLKCAPLVASGYAMMAGAGAAKVAERFSENFRRALDQAREAITGRSVLDESFQKHAHRVPDHITVFATQSDFGVAAKAQRGIAPNMGDMPESLQSMKNSLGRFATRMGINLAGSVQNIAKQAETALRARVAVPAPPSAARGQTSVAAPSM